MRVAVGTISTLVPMSTMMVPLEFQTRTSLAFRSPKPWSTDIVVHGIFRAAAAACLFSSSILAVGLTSGRIPRPDRNGARMATIASQSKSLSVMQRTDQQREGHEQADCYGWLLPDLPCDLLHCCSPPSCVPRGFSEHLLKLFLALLVAHPSQSGSYSRPQGSKPWPTRRWCSCSISPSVSELSTLEFHDFGDLRLTTWPSCWASTVDSRTGTIVSTR